MRPQSIHFHATTLCVEVATYMLLIEGRLIPKRDIKVSHDAVSVYKSFIHSLPTNKTEARNSFILHHQKLRKRCGPWKYTDMYHTLRIPVFSSTGLCLVSFSHWGILLFVTYSFQWGMTQFVCHLPTDRYLSCSQVEDVMDKAFIKLYIIV